MKVSSKHWGLAKNETRASISNDRCEWTQRPTSDPVWQLLNYWQTKIKLASILTGATTELQVFKKKKKTPPVELQERQRGAATEKYCLRKGELGVGGNMFCCCAWWRLDEAKARTLITASTPTVTVTVTAAAQDTQRQAEVTENCRHLFFAALIQEVIKSYFFSTFESFWRIPLIHPPRLSSLHNPL